MVYWRTQQNCGSREIGHASDTRINNIHTSHHKRYGVGASNIRHPESSTLLWPHIESPSHTQYTLTLALILTNGRSPSILSLTTPGPTTNKVSSQGTKDASHGEIHLSRRTRRGSWKISRQTNGRRSVSKVSLPKLSADSYNPLGRDWKFWRKCETVFPFLWVTFIINWKYPRLKRYVDGFGRPCFGSSKPEYSKNLCPDNYCTLISPWWTHCVLTIHNYFTKNTR